MAHVWYLVHAKPRQEDTALANLARQGYEAFLPRMRRQVRHAGRWRERVEAMFPRYLFLRLAAGDEDWRPVHSTFGVSRLVRFGDQPARVPTDLVDYLRARADAEDIVRVEPTAEFAPGQDVRVIEGPLAGIEGIVTANGARERVDVLLRVVAEAATVRISRHHLAPT